MVDLNLQRTLFDSNDITLDLGTDNTLIYVKGFGVVVDKTTLLAVNESEKSMITIVRAEKNLIVRVPANIELVQHLINEVHTENDMQ